MNKLCLIGAAALIAIAFLPDVASARGGGMGVASAGAQSAEAFGERRLVVSVALRSAPAFAEASGAAGSEVVRLGQTSACNPSTNQSTISCAPIQVP
jgi:hypothetical protein